VEAGAVDAGADGAVAGDEAWVAGDETAGDVGAGAFACAANVPQAATAPAHATTKTPIAMCLAPRRGVSRADIATPDLVRPRMDHGGVLLHETPYRRAKVAVTASSRDEASLSRHPRRRQPRAFARGSAGLNARLRAIGPTLMD